METLGAARLAKRIPEQRAVATIVPREEIAAVVEDREGSPELLLRVISEGPDRSEESSEIALTWSRDELARILDEATGPNVVLTFDREELAKAIDDVEAHGLRERALVFAVAATGVLGTGAAIANAMPVDTGGAVVTATAPAVSAATSVTDVSSAGGYSTAAAASGAADTMVSDAASGAGYAAPASVPGASAAALGVTDVSSAGGYAAPATTAGGSPTGPGATDVSSGGGYGAVEATSSSPEVIGIPRSDVTDGLIAGGVLLAIAGATFASRRTGTARPA